jgi:deoxyadenosine/deoxycytidine kinase
MNAHSCIISRIQKMMFSPHIFCKYAYTCATSKFNTMARIISVDGNIGAGKTTVLEHISRMNHDHRVRLDLEPVSKWQPWLEKMYITGSGVFDFQIRVWLDRCWPMIPSTSEDLFIERSPLFQENVFVPANITNGKLTSDQASIIHELYAKTAAIWDPTIYIYLQSDPGKCAERIIRRGRASEDNIPITYLKELHTLHEEAYNIASASGKKIYIINVEGKTVPEIAEEIMKLMNAE